MLDGDAAAQRFNALQVAVGDRLAVIEEPVEPLEGNLAIDLLEHVQEAADAFIECGVQPERPSVGCQESHHLAQLAFEG